MNIFAPLCAMVLVTFLVWSWMYYTRLTTIFRSGKVQDVLADDDKTAVILKDVMNPSDNFENLFETPVLFYVAVFAILQAGIVDRPFVDAAWVYVALRALHSLVHSTYNKVIHRFTAYFLSSLVLWAMWIRIAAKVCCPHSSV
jgi:hypothetical protein